MNKRLVIIHTVPPLLEVFTRLAVEMLPDVSVYHLLDELMLEQIRRHGSLPAEGLSRLIAYIRAAEDIGASAVLVTCSSVSPYVDGITSSIAVVKIDDAMLTQAAEQGRVIGVLATNPTTLEPTCRALDKKIGELGKQVGIIPRVVEGAFSALMEGDGKEHDRLVCESMVQIAGQVDLILLAQASMARVVETYPQWPVPVLTSPQTAFARIRQILEGGAI